MLNEFSKLERHLSADLFNSDLSGDTLFIIDDYNVDYNMRDETLLKFVNAISSVKQIKKVKIYIQMKRNSAGYDECLFQFNNSCRKSKFKQFESAYLKKRKFVEEFRHKGIDCSFVVYRRFNVKPPFHGRYWLSGAAGFIVDGSINTVESKVVLAQVMDEENYWLIRNMTQKLFDLDDDETREFNQNSLDELYLKWSETEIKNGFYY